MKKLSGRLFFWVSIIATVVSMNFWAVSMLVTEVTTLFITLTVINAVSLLVVLVCMFIDVYNVKKRGEQRASEARVREILEEDAKKAYTVEAAEPEAPEVEDMPEAPATVEDADDGALAEEIAELAE